VAKEAKSWKGGKTGSAIFVFELCKFMALSIKGQKSGCRDCQQLKRSEEALVKSSGAWWRFCGNAFIFQFTFCQFFCI
jgi:hypothetical protein